MNQLPIIDRVELTTTNPVKPMLDAIIAGGITPESAAALERVTDLYLKMEAESAKKSFAAAKSAMQSELPRVVAQRSIPSRDGTVRSTFAAYEDVMEVVSPYLAKYGFSVSFTVRIDDGAKASRICAVCRLSHAGGHSETNEFAVRVGGGPPGCSEAQADGSARSYARRGALCDALNIVVDHDNDARAEGDYITSAQAASLEGRVKATGSDETKFLRLAGAGEYASIRATRYQMLDDMLRRKEGMR